jgi:hypothetical protein
MKLVAWFSLALTLSLWSGSMGKAYLCVGTGNHMHVEFLADGTCSLAPGVTPATARNALASRFSSPCAGDGCGPCTDIALSFSGTVRSATMHATPLLAQQQLSLAPAPTAVTTPPARALASERQPGAPGEILTQLSSVVLLI